MFKQLVTDIRKTTLVNMAMEKFNCMIFYLFLTDIGQSNTDLLSGLGGVFTSVQPAALANSTAHSAVSLTTNHNLNPLETTFTSPGEKYILLPVKRREAERCYM
jgi:hypothetical protein